MTSRQARSQARLRAERRAAGLCAEGCGAPSLVYRCPDCQRSLSARQARWRARRREILKPGESPGGQ